jgi:hypothetical protein
VGWPEEGRLAARSGRQHRRAGQGLQYQQDMTGLRIAIAILVAPSNDIDDLRPLIPGLLGALEGLLPGTITRVGL